MLKLEAEKLQIPLLAAKPIRSLQISNHLEMSDEELLKILSQCPNIETLELLHCPKIGDPTLFYLAQSAPALRSLCWIGPTQATEEGYSSLANHASSLQSLNVSGSYFSTRACQQLLATHPTLASLDVSFCPIDDSAFSRLSSPLQFLNLQGCASLTDKTLFTLARAASLRHLFLAFNEKISSIGLRALAPLSLQTLRISHCPQLQSA